MSESEIRTETVVIPGQLRLSNPVPPPVTVPLPIVAWPHGPINFWLGLLLFVGGLLCLPTAMLIAYGLVMMLLGVFEFQATLKASLGYLFLLTMCPWMLLWGVSCLGFALTCFWDAIRSGPVLEITADGLRDYRSGLSAPWSSVRSARILGVAPAYSVDLQLGAPVAIWRNPFRAGILFQRYRPIPDHVIVSCAHLDVRGHDLVYAILTLVQWNGGEVSTKTRGALDMGLRILPRPREAARSARSVAQ